MVQKKKKRNQSSTSLVDGPNIIVQCTHCMYTVHIRNCNEKSKMAVHSVQCSTIFQITQLLLVFIFGTFFGKRIYFFFIFRKFFFLGLKEANSHRTKLSVKTLFEGQVHSILVGLCELICSLSLYFIDFFFVVGYRIFVLV